MGRTARITITVDIDEDPEWLKELADGDEDTSDNDVAHDVIRRALDQEPEATLRDFGSGDIEPIEIEISGE